MTWPPSKPISIRTRWRQPLATSSARTPCDGVGVDEGDLEPEEPAVRLLVDQLDALLGEASQLALEIVDLVGDVVHPGPAAGEELADRGLVAERREQLDAAVADAHRRRFDALLGHRVAVLDLGAEQPRVRVDRLVEILDGDSEMMDPLRLHARRS